MRGASRAGRLARFASGTGPLVQGRSADLLLGSPVMAVPSPELHPALGPVKFLLGTWRGTGQGSYPTIESFSYVEEISFGHVGKPFLAYSQRTRHAETNLPLHAETGYWRMVGPCDLEVVLAHPTGILESFVGVVESTVEAADYGGDHGGVHRIELQCDQIVRSPTAVSVTETKRVFTIEGDALTYDVSMAAADQPLTHHLTAHLIKV